MSVFSLLVATEETPEVLSLLPWLIHAFLSLVSAVGSWVLLSPKEVLEVIGVPHGHHQMSEVSVIGHIGTWPGIHVSLLLDGLL